MDLLAQDRGANACASVWKEGHGFHVSVEFYNPRTGSRQSIGRMFDGDRDGVRDLIAREVGRHGFDLGRCAIFWHLDS